MEEEWKPVVGYEGLYEVSNLGRVKSLDRIDSIGRKRNGKILKQHITIDERCRVTLSKNNKRKYFLVHRLVAIAFIPNPDNLPEVNHKDENPNNNYLDNLEWCTSKYNANYGTRNERASEKKKGKKLTEEHKRKIGEAGKGEKNPRAKRVRCITTGETFKYIKEASEKYNINKSDISSCCKGKLKSAGKHPITGEKLVWEYV